MLEWVVYLKYLLIFFKFEFLKVYDMVDWGFLFLIMVKFGIFFEFIDMIKLFFYDVIVLVKVNGVFCVFFGIIRGCDKGFLVFYLF